MPVRGTEPEYTIGRQMIPYDDSGTYHYYCYSAPGTALATAKHWVTRVTDADSTVRHAQPPGFNHAATDLATVAALTFA